MKKFLCLTMAAVLCMCFAGCSIKDAERKVDEIEDKVESKTEKIEDKVEKKAEEIEDNVEKKVSKFSGDGTWESVEEQYDAIEVLGGAITINSEKCTLCRDCVEVCPLNVINI